MILQATLKEVNAYLQVVIPDDPLFEVQYHLLKEHLFSKYRRPLPDEFSSKSGGGDFLPGSDGSETAAFTPAPRITEADEQNDTRSLRRALDKRLFFLVKSKGDILASPNLACQSSSACYQVCLPAFATAIPVSWEWWALPSDAAILPTLAIPLDCTGVFPLWPMLPAAA